MTDNPNFEGDTMSSTSLIEQAIARVKIENTLTMADMTSTCIDVESWLQVDKYGLHLDKSQEAIEFLEVEIDLSEVAPVYMVRFGKNPPTYRKSYDGVTTFGSSKPWQLTVQEAQALDPECKGQYAAVEIPMRLLETVELKRDKKTIERQTRIGHTTSVTNYRLFQRFWNECQKEGLAGAVVKVRLGYEVRRSNGNEWGVVTFELVE
jgi:hypothetical protein